MVDGLDLGFFDRFRLGMGLNTVRILLDVDGAVAPLGPLPEGSYLSFDGSGYATWRVRNRVLEWLDSMRSDDRVELVWSTTWQEYANSIFEEQGLEPIDWIRFDDTYQMPGDWYKKDGIGLYLEDSKDPIVIVDDELPNRFLGISNPRILCIKPDPQLGLTDEELARIDRFVDDYRNRRLL